MTGNRALAERLEETERDGLEPRVNKHPLKRVVRGEGEGKEEGGKGAHRPFQPGRALLKFIANAQAYKRAAGIGQSCDQVKQEDLSYVSRVHHI